MSRRYLTEQEAMAALKRGKDIEIFLGGFERGSDQFIEWATFTLKDNHVLGKLWQAYDEGSQDFCDIYSFSPTNDEWDVPIKESVGDDITSAVENLGVSSRNFTNHGVAQDEYANYKNT